MTVLIDLMRHGEPLGGRKYRGQKDDPLSERGWAQMRAAAGQSGPWSAVVSSPLRRCAAFARELADSRGLALRLDADLREVGFGAWEGLTREELEAQSPGVVARFYRDPLGQRPAGAESLCEFRERVLRAWARLLQRPSGRHVLVVAHAGVIRVIVAEVLGMPLSNLYRLQVPNAGLTRIAVEGADHTPAASLVFHAGSRRADD